VEICSTVVSPWGNIATRGAEKSKAIFASVFNSQICYFQGIQPPELDTGAESRINLP